MEGKTGGVVGGRIDSQSCARVHEVSHILLARVGKDGLDSFVGDPLANALKLPRHPQFHTRNLIYWGARLYLYGYSAA